MVLGPGAETVAVVAVVVVVAEAGIGVESTAGMV